MVRPRVVHHPPRHPFLDHLDPGSAVDVWSVDALRAAGVDVVHLHFGFEHVSAAELAAWTSGLAAAGIALVHTVHDLDNPHLVDQAPHRERLRVLADDAAELVTLTPWAAEQLRHRYGRRATVIAHPPILPATTSARLRDHPGARAGVYVHGATLRPNLDLDLVAELASEAARWGGLTVHVRERADVGPDAVAALRRIAAAGGDIDTCARLSDDELWERLRRARVVLLPYRWGTHSGLLEAALDLGTPVVAPRCGGYGDQGATTYGPGAAADALDRATVAPTTVDRCARAARCQRSRDAHEAVYVRAVSR